MTAIAEAAAQQPPGEAASPRVMQRLIEIRKWTRVLVVACSFVGMATMFNSIVGAVKTGDLRGHAFLFVLAACYLAGANLLVGYSRSLSQLFKERSTAAMEDVFRQLHRFWTGAAIAGGAAALASVALFLVPSVIAQYRHTRMQATLSDMQKISTALEKYAAEHHGYPDAKSFAAMIRQIEPKYGTSLPRHDIWKNDFRYSAQCGYLTCWSYRLASCGSDGICSFGDLFKYGPQLVGADSKADLLYGNGRPLAVVAGGAGL